MKQLTPEEEDIIENKATERRFTGEYNDHYRDGTYLCKRCESPLYHSESKFDSGCGWPAFEDQIPWAVRRILDEDGIRTEIVCTHCGAHLWHVFVWEQLTDTNTRHCVNSLSMIFTPEIKTTPEYERATFWWWCFRCMEAAFEVVPWVIEVLSGFSGWKRKFPRYEQVITWSSWHAEVVQLIYDPEIVSYDRLLEIFFTIHNPTTLNQQGNDIWTQYRSVIFFHNSSQEKIALQKKKDLTAMYVDPLVTEIAPLETFWIAEAYHQDFFKNNPEKAYCKMVVQPKVQKVEEMILLSS